MSVDHLLFKPNAEIKLQDNTYPVRKRVQVGFESRLIPSRDVHPISTHIGTAFRRISTPIGQAHTSLSPS